MSNFLGLIRSKLGEKDTPSLVHSSSSSSIAPLSPRAFRNPRLGNAQLIIDDLKISLRQKVIETKRESLSCMNDFELLYRSLTTSQTLNYEDFLECAKNAPITTQRFFTAQNFLMFPKDKRGGILVESFLRFVQRSIDVELVCLQLMTHVQESTLGFINEQELERFILERIPEIGACEDLPESFYPYYVFTASRRYVCHKQSSPILSIYTLLTHPLTSPSQCRP